VIGTSREAVWALVRSQASGKRRGGEPYDSRIRGSGRATGLMNRLSERGVLDRLVGAVRAGESQALVMRGDPGLVGEER